MNNSKKILKIFIWLYVILMCVAVLTPLIICLVNSFRSTGDLLRGFLAFPKELTFDNYTRVVIGNEAYRYLTNSLIITVVAVLVSFLITPFIAFVIVTRWECKRYRVLFFILTACMLIPDNILLFPLIKLLYSLKLMNVAGLIICYAVYLIPGNLFIFVPYFRALDKGILEAAHLDGCSEMQLYSQVFLPVCKPIVFTVMIINTIWIWNDFLMPLMILNKSPDTWTIPIFIYNFLGRSSFKKNLAFATCQLALLPIFLFYGAFSKEILSGLHIYRPNEVSTIPLRTDRRVI